MAEGAQDEDGGVTGPEPRPATVTFITTEHFTLQGARAATIAESTGRATMLLGAVSGGLVALGLFATATRVGSAFRAATPLLPLHVQGLFAGRWQGFRTV